jgi:phenylalanyl-tRNA synthetase beta chain
MLVSTNWLADYVQVPRDVEGLVERLALAGLNHESTRRLDADTVLELEVTSNRPDWLGHIGVAREIAVLFARPLQLPEPRPLEVATAAATSVAVEIEDDELCPFYSARVIRGVHVGPSPEWLVQRLAAVGMTSVNNVVDVTNYVMLESGQPLHAFDLAWIHGGRIVVRASTADETFTAINHKTYRLPPGTCVIADAERAVALAGVMGGAESEIDGTTTDVLLESAQFRSGAVRAAARGLGLASPSSHRFERGPDPGMVGWASLRAAALIMELAGGRLERQAVTSGRLVAPQAVIPLAGSYVSTVLGTDVPELRQRTILASLGFVEQPPAAPAGPPRWQAPTWRRDVTRDIDLVEEIGRIEGYDAVPEDVPIAVRAVEWPRRERSVRRAGEPLVAAGLCEAMTRSVVDARLEAAGSPWGDGEPRVIVPPLVRGADRLRRTLVPSLLEARAYNAAVGAPHGDLFEIARGYLPWPAATSTGPSPLEEPLLLAMVVTGEFLRGKGLADAVLAGLGLDPALVPPGPDWPAVEYRPAHLEPFTVGRSAEILLHRTDRASSRVGVIGEVAAGLLEMFRLEGPVVAVEYRLDLLEFAVDLARPMRRPSDFPAVQRDLNLVVDEAVPWGTVEAAIRQAAGPLLEDLRLTEVWRDTDKLGAGRKSFVTALRLRSYSGTLSGDDAAEVIDRVVAACGQAAGAILRG